MIELESGDEVWAQFIVCDGTSVNAPESKGFVGAATGNAELFGDVENSTRHNTAMIKLLDWATIIQVPYDNFHICTRCQQVILVGLFRAPADVEYV